MAKVKIGRWEIDESELERQQMVARKRGEQRLKIEPRATFAHYDRKADRIVVEMMNGCIFMFPPELAQGLAGASPNLLAEVKVMPQGFALGWDTLDVHLSLAGLMSGIFGNKAWMTELGRKGGSRTSEAKAAASRANGQKGGRPRKS